MKTWRKIRLGDACKTNMYSYSPKEKWNFVNYLDTGNITDNKIDLIQYIDIVNEKLPSRARRKVKKDSIIYSTVRPNQHHFGIIKSQPENFLVSTGFAVIDTDSQVLDADFLYYLLTQSTIVESLHAIAEQSTSAYPSIKPSDIENLEIEIPDIATQKKIADVLFSLDKKMAQNRKINKNLLQQAQTIFTEEFLSLDGIPEGWSESSLLGIANYLNGLAMQKFRPSDNEQGLPVLKIKELRQGSCDANSERCSLSIKPEYIVHDGDVIFSWSGSLLVDFWCGGTCGLNQHLFKVTSTDYDKWFYFAWTNHHLQKFTAIAADMATTMGHIKREELAKSRVLIPSNSDYERIGGLLAPLYNLVISNRIENSKLATIRDTLLPKLMSGQLDVSNLDL